MTNIPSHMRACVWRGGRTIAVESVPVPSCDDGEVLVKIEECALCPTDIKKIDLSLAEPPRIFGHEMVGEVVAAGAGADGWMGRRVALYHHVPCRACSLCRLGLYSQCEGYKKTGVTAGFAPAGGGWAEYVKAAPWIVAGGGVVDVPASVPTRAAILMEPLNTCLKCIQALPEQSGGKLVVLGLGPVGLMLTAIASIKGWEVYGVEPVADRQARGRQFGAKEIFSPNDEIVTRLKQAAGDFGPDAAIAATDNESAINAALNAIRPGGTVILFGHTRVNHALTVDGGQIGMIEKRLIGSYSSSIELNDEVVRLLEIGRFPWQELVTHEFPMEGINEALALARKPANGSLKMVITTAK